MDPISAYRFCYGRIVAEPDGPTIPGFEGRPTSVSQGIPDGLVPFCRPPELFSGRPVAELVHPTREREGALFFWPAACEGRRWMIATCVRARPESGEGGGGRSYRQSASFAFAESDWCEHAPRLIANAPRWLRTEPDTLAFHEEHLRLGDYPPVLLGPEGLAEVPPCTGGPLPRPGGLIWRLASATTLPGPPLVCGPAVRIDSVANFLRALACASALLPKPLRIYLTAAAGLSSIEPLFGIQYLPQASALTGREPAMLERLAERLLHREPHADHLLWQALWTRQAGGEPGIARALAELGDIGAWQTPQEARARIAFVFERLAADRALADLEDWLDGRHPQSPPCPSLRQASAGARWISRLVDRLNDPDTNPGSAARAILRLATLTDSGPQGLAAERADYWRRAWRDAAHQGGREVLRWSALDASSALEEPFPTGRSALGQLLDFGELRALMEAVHRIKTQSPEAAAAVSQALNSAAFRARLEGLRRRANRVLSARPLGAMDLAASFPSLLHPRPTDSADLARTLGRAVRTLWIAASLDEWRGGAPPARRLGLREAVTRIAERSLKEGKDPNLLRQDLIEHGDRWLRALVRRYRQWAMAPSPERDPDCTLWHDAILGCIAERSEREGPGLPIQRFLDAVTAEFARSEKSGSQPSAEVETAAALTADLLRETLASGRDPVGSAAELLTVLPGLVRAMSDPTLGPLARALGYTLTQAIQGAVRTAEPQRLLDPLLPALVSMLSDWTVPAARVGALASIAPLLDLSESVLDGLLSLGPSLPRAAVGELIDRLEPLVQPAPAPRATPPEPVERLARVLARCALAWAQADPPEPWLCPPSQPPNEPRPQTPIRLALARRLGFPRCLYVAGLLPLPHEHPLPKGLAEEPGYRSSVVTSELLGLSPDLKPALARVLAFGACQAWRGLHAHPDSLSAQTLERLWHSPVSAEAADALAELSRSRHPFYARSIEEQTRFVVDFLDALGVEDNSPKPPVPPEALASALVAAHPQDPAGMPYATWLGRAIVGTHSNLATRLPTLLEHRNSNRLLAQRVLGLGERCWQGLAGLDEPNWRQGMQRLLFLLGLLVERRLFRRPEAGRLAVSAAKLTQFLSLPSDQAAARAAVAERLAASPGLTAALKTALDAVGLARLPGWPESVQPRRGGG